ncbi:MAG: hypothetical protein JWP10_1220, partial [Nocardioidaceae bacterium]|nr:hypothetical protein [Nocardioidaceae bacterium]
HAHLYATEFGDRTHVVITLRGLGAMLPSIWQQFIKSGMRADFDWWLTHVLDDPPRTEMTPSYYLRNDQAGVVRRWASEVGADNVTVVILDKNRPNLLFDAFEGMLGLPQGLLRNVETREFRQNRSLSAEEAFLVMEFNRRAHEAGMSWLEYQRLLRRGSVQRILELSNAAESGTKLILPEWAAERARELGRSYAASIADSGVRVIGDLAELSAEVPTRGDEFLRVPMIPADTAAEALAGMASAALWRGSNFREAKVPLSEVEKTVARQSERLDSADPGVRRTAVARQAKDISTADLARLLLSRLKRKVGLK